MKHINIFVNGTLTLKIDCSISLSGWLLSDMFRKLLIILRIYRKGCIHSWKYPGDYSNATYAIPFSRIILGMGWASERRFYIHDDVIKFSALLPFVREIHRSPVKSPHKGQWRGALMFSLIYTWIYGWVNNREADDLRRHRALYDVTAMEKSPGLIPRMISTSCVM